MTYLLICLIVVFVFIYFFKNKNLQEKYLEEDPRLFETTDFIDKESIKSAKCPQCGKEAISYDDVKQHFGLRKVGYTTDIQSWCRECRRDKEERRKNQPKSESLNLFDE